MTRLAAIALGGLLALLALGHCATEKPSQAPPPAPKCMRLDRASGRSSEVPCADRDEDQDGADDAVDLCPRTPPLARKFADANGCPVPDSDGDQIPDAIDDCAHQAGQPPTGCPSQDADGDRIADHLDSCPYAAEDFNGVDDQDGCPDGADVLVVLRQDIIYVRQPIHFLKKSAMLLPDSKELLDRVAEGLKPHRGRIDRIRVVGHVDPREVSKARAIALSRTRARIVARYLIAQGIDRTLFDTEALGARQPLSRGKRGRDRERNQRVELLVTLRAAAGQEAAPDAGAAVASAVPDAAPRAADAATAVVAVAPPDAGTAAVEPATTGEVQPYREEEEWDQEFLDEDWDATLLKK
ncbi:MAG: OmpA family protein [Deltaproteobacteria bacterium]|nr:OmpA family protein [Deltaproteobacteria bacterium]